jgi:hypothetical protein
MRHTLNFLSAFALASLLLTACDSDRMTRQQPTVAPTDANTGVYNNTTPLPAPANSPETQPVDSSIDRRSGSSTVSPESTSTITTDVSSTSTTMRPNRRTGSSTGDHDSSPTSIRKINQNGTINNSTAPETDAAGTELDAGSSENR